MAGTRKCAYCDQDAIGYQSFGCSSTYVCRDHASGLLLELGPGKRLSTGDCHIERFDTSDP